MAYDGAAQADVTVPPRRLFSLLVIAASAGVTGCMFPQSDSPETKAKALLSKCEAQLQKSLPFPDTYRPTSLLDSAFITIPQLSNGDTETVVWDFLYEAEKPNTIVGQASDRPFLKGVGQCEINKKTGDVKAEVMSR